MSKPFQKCLLALFLLALLVQLSSLLHNPSVSPPTIPTVKPYLAPFRCPINPEERSPQSYVVHFSAPHSFEQHSKAIKDIVHHVKEVHDLGTTVYSAVNVDYGLLEAIRADEKVWFVECVAVLKGDARGMRSR